MTNEVVHLAHSLQHDDLETAWSQAVQAPEAASVSDYCKTIDLLCEQGQTSRAVTLATDMVAAMTEANALDEAIDIAMTVVRRGAHSDSLATDLAGLLHRHYGEENWWPTFSDRAKLDVEAVAAQSLMDFDRLRSFTKGNVIYHAGGWGEAIVEEFHPDRQEVSIAFATGRREDFPLDTIIDSFKPLAKDDLRTMKLKNMDDLQRMTKEDPSGLIRIAAKLYRGTIQSQKVKQELVPTVVAQRSWASFWKRAKTAATKDPWLKVEGTATRPVFVLRKKPVNLADEAATALTHCNDLGERIATLRDYLARGQDADVRTHILELAETTVEQAIAAKKDNHAHLLDGILFLVEHDRPAPAAAGDELRALMIDEEGKLHAEAIDQLATQQSREHAVTLLPDALGEQWADQILSVLGDVPVSVLEPIVNRLVESGNSARILEQWNRVAPYPRRHPLLTYLLGRLYADGEFDSIQDRPDLVSVGRVQLHLARVLTSDRKGSSFRNRLLSRLTSLLAGKRAFLRRALDGISKEDLGSYLGIAERAGEDFPQEITDIILRHVSDHYPDLTATPEKPFWERDDAIYTTQTGLNRIQEDYRVLVEDKIPENSKAIGAAASLGDLSENSEWESAMEEQRTLTTRASEMDNEIRSARLIEHQQVTGEVVAPGTRVSLRVESSGEVRNYTILGPWDVVDDSTINYRAPIAKGLLGRSPGETGEMPSANGPIKVIIDSIETV